MIDGKEMISYDFCDISIAVSGPKGLMVPVIRNAETLSFRGVEAEVKRLATRARDGQITVDEMTGGTFTISNGWDPRHAQHCGTPCCQGRADRRGTYNVCGPFL